MALQSKFLFYFFIIALVPVTIISTFSFFKIQEELTSTTINQLSLIADVQKKRVNEALDRYLESVKLVASRTQLRVSLSEYEQTGSQGALDKIQSIISDAKVSVSTIDIISIRDQSGKTVASTNSISSGLIGSQSVGKSDELSKYAKDIRTFTLFDVFKNESNLLRVRLFGPLFLESQKIGAVEVIMSVNPLVSITEDYSGLGKTGEVVLANKNQAGDALFLTPLRFDSGAALTRAIPQNKPNVPIIDAINGKEAIFEDGTSVDYRGQPVFAVTRFIDALNWGLVAKIDQAEALSPAIVFRNTYLFIILFILFILTISALFVSNALASPIKRLTLRAQALAALDFSSSSSSSSSSSLTNRKDEIGTLGRAFNNMVSKLKESYATLEQKVRDRTQDLAEAKAKDEAILSSIGDAVMACDKNGQVMLFNGVAEVLSGFSAKEVVGQHHSHSLKFIKEIDQKPSDDFIAEAIKTGRATKMANHTLLITKDGHKIPVADSASPIKNAEGQIIGCVIVFRDVTKERELDRSKTEFISIASHQLRTPVSALNWLAEALQFNSKNFSPKQKTYLGDLSSMTRRLIKLVEDLLDFSRIELKTGLAAEKNQIEIASFVEKFIKEIGTYALSKNHNVVLKKEDFKPTEIEINTKALVNILQNLLSNAIEYSPSNTAVTVVLENIAGAVKVFIYNKGPVIPKEEQPKLFERFYRGESAKKMKAEGTGLGLYIVKNEIENIGGKVGFESVEGKDTYFWFTLPLKITNKKII